ncbi:MAG: LacI family DNA-binding transcriptional regulator [Clostridia bacterium]|nr:LacI family DNA-binding transcriptional regulator [Clostridia bacterium]
MVTLKDVAKRAGVSPSTVSRTLSNRVFVEEETREKVMKAVKELNYQPSITARALREGKTYSLALLVPDINSLFYPEIMGEIEKVASDQGYTILLCNCNESLEKEKQTLSLVCGRGVDGILCLSVKDEISHLLSVEQEKKIPVVLVNRNGSGSLSSISIDDEYGGYLMTRTLLEKGHVRIAGIFGGFEHERFRNRYSGCRRAMEECGIQDYKRYFCYDINSVEEAYQKTREMLNREDRPTAFFATMDVLTFGIYRGIADSGLRIPDDISVVGYDDIFMAKYMIPSLTTYHAPMDQIAGKAVELLKKKIDEPESKPERIVIKGSLMSRQSVKAL